MSSYVYIFMLRRNFAITNGVLPLDRCPSLTELFIRMHAVDGGGHLLIRRK